MKNSDGPWFSRRPYTVTSLIFLVVIVVGWQLLGWGERQFGFLLLLYFIVALGIRLDEISQIIGGSAGNPRLDHDPPESISAQLGEIRSILRQIQASLDKTLRPNDREEV
jgi:hypothetical protein